MNSICISMPINKRSKALIKNNSINLFSKEKSTVSCKIHSNIKLMLRSREQFLLNLASGIYIADQTFERNESLDYWTRSIELNIEEGYFKKEHINLLSDILNNLSGDNWTINIIDTPKYYLQNKNEIFGKNKLKKNEKVDCVCLFSGGVDSFVGALKCLEKFNRVLLVSHITMKNIKPIQTELYKVIKEKFKDRVNFVQISIPNNYKVNSKYKIENNEKTHRVRSFLFLSLGAVIASCIGTNMVWVPENGTMSLNPPLSPSRIGSLSTRTTSPAFLSKFQRLINILLDKNIIIENPFRILTKGEVVKACPEEFRNHLLKTISCAKYGTFNDRNNQCGYCLPCIQRRAAFHKIGLDVKDNNYRIDIRSQDDVLTDSAVSEKRVIEKFIYEGNGLSDMASIFANGWLTREDDMKISGTDVHFITYKQAKRIIKRAKQEYKDFFKIK